MNLYRYIAIALLGSIPYVVAPLEAAATSAQKPTIVTVKKLCPTCGKRILQKISELPHVADTTMNIEQRTILVRCTPDGSVSPRAVWEAVERGGEQPIKLQGPMGTFTTKPPQ